MSIRKKTLIIIAAICAAMAVLLIIIGMSRSKKEQNNIYLLKSDQDTVALYKNDEIIEIYDNITLETLPLPDRTRLSNGIELSSPEEAQKIIEDYDG